MFNLIRRQSGSEKIRNRNKQTYSRFGLLLVAVVAGLLVLGHAARERSAAGQGPGQFPAPNVIIAEENGKIVPHFDFDIKIDPKTPIKDLLPTPPKNRPDVVAVPEDDLSLVPEITFQQRAENAKKAAPIFIADMGKLTAQARFLNQKEVDGFLKALIKHRDDLAGLSFVMDDDCRMEKDNRSDFKFGLEVLRKSLQKTVPAGLPALVPLNAATAAMFWNEYQSQWTLLTNKGLVHHPFHHEKINAAHIAGLMQVLLPEASPMRQGLAKYLASVPHVEATRALAKLAIFSMEKEVRQEAIKALKVRREKDYADILLTGLKYPWPVVADRAAEALVQLECTSMVPQLVEMLDDPDPRAPMARKEGNQEVLVAKQMVRLNHHHNCLLCHSPVDKTTPRDAVTAPMPIPGMPLGSFQEGYHSFFTPPDLFIRVDVTYLRQDFSVLQPVQDSHPWPRMQRFDFLVREVTLTPAQAKTLQKKLQPKAGTGSPYQEIVLVALRGLTGQDAAPTPQAWKKALRLPG